MTESSRRRSAAGSVAVAVTAVAASFILRETTDLAFGWRLLIAVPLGVVAALVVEAVINRRG